MENLKEFSLDVFYEVGKITWISQVLTVYYNNGRIVQYYEVPGNIYEGLFAGSNLGDKYFKQYLQDNVIDKYISSIIK